MSVDLNNLSNEFIDEKIEKLFQEVLFNPQEFENHIDIILLSLKKNDYSRSCSFFYGLINNIPSFSTIKRILKKSGYKEFFQSIYFPNNVSDISLIKSYFLYFFGFIEELENSLNYFDKEDFSFNGFYYDLLKFILFFENEDDYEKGVSCINLLLQEFKSKGIVNNLAGLFYWDYDEFDLAVKFISFAIEINPFCVDYYYNRGSIFYDYKKYNVAIKDFKKCISLNSGESRSYVALGKSMFKSNRFSIEDSVSQIEKGIKIDSKSETGYQALYEIYKESNSPPFKCIEILSNLIRISPNNAHYFYERSKWWLYPIQLKNVVLDLEKAISLNSEEYDFYKSYSFSLFGLKDFQGAIEALHKCLEIKPSLTFLNLEIAKNYFYLLDFENTVIFMKRELVSDWELEDFYIYGYSASKLGRFEESIYYYSKGIEKFDAPDYDFVLYSLLHSGRGYSYKILGELMKSGSDFTRSSWACDMFYEYNPSEKIEKRFPAELREFD